MTREGLEPNHDRARQRFGEYLPVVLEAINGRVDPISRKKSAVFLCPICSGRCGLPLNGSGGGDVGGTSEAGEPAGRAMAASACNDQNVQRQQAKRSAGVGMGERAVGGDGAH